MPLGSNSLEPALRQRIASLLEAHRVVLFMKGNPAAPQCGFSAKSVAALDALGIDFAHVDVLADPAIREGIKAYGDWPTIPQLYIDGELVGGSDIIEQMSQSGELHAALGLPPPDRTPPPITVTPAAFEMLHKALHDAGSGYTLKVDIDAHFNARLQLAPIDANAIATEIDGIRVQFDLASARRAPGLSIDWVDDERGRGLVIDNPNAPPKVRDLSPLETAGKLAADVAQNPYQQGVVAVREFPPALTWTVDRPVATLVTLATGSAAVRPSMSPQRSARRSCASRIACRDTSSLDRVANASAAFPTCSDTWRQERTQSRAVPSFDPNAVLSRTTQRRRRC